MPYFTSYFKKGNVIKQLAILLLLLEYITPNTVYYYYLHANSVLFVLLCRVQMALGMYYNVEYSIQETTCPRSTEAGATQKCQLMECEFAVSG